MKVLWTFMNPNLQRGTCDLYREGFSIPDFCLDLDIPSRYHESPVENLKNYVS